MEFHRLSRLDRHIVTFLMAHLPTEIVLRIVESLEPDNALSLPPADSIARTIWAFLFVSRSTYVPALKLLYKYVLYVDSPGRLMQVLNAIAAHKKRGETNVSTLPRVDIAASLQHLYLAPYRASIDDLPMAQWIFELAAIMQGTVKRLYLNIPFASLRWESDHLSVLPRLKHACDQFAEVEQAVIAFAATRELEVPFRDTTIPPWYTWGSLRKLALVDIGFLGQAKTALTLLVHLEIVVIVWIEEHLFRAGVETTIRWSLQRDLVMLHVLYKGSDAWTGRRRESMDGRRTKHGHLTVEIRQLTQHARNMYSRAEDWIALRGASGQLFDLEYLDTCGDFDSSLGITVG